MMKKYQGFGDFIPNQQLMKGRNDRIISIVGYYAYRKNQI